jgi:hypothetical protein
MVDLTEDVQQMKRLIAARRWNDAALVFRELCTSFPMHPQLRRRHGRPDPSAGVPRAIIRDRATESILLYRPQIATRRSSRIRKRVAAA